MKKEAFAKRLAKATCLSQPAAADLVDRVVADVVRKLRSGQAALLPGLGTIHPVHRNKRAKQNNAGEL